MPSDTAVTSVIDHLLQQFPAKLSVLGGRLRSVRPEHQPEPVGDLQLYVDPALNDKDINQAVANYFASKGFIVKHIDGVASYFTKGKSMLGYYTTRLTNDDMMFTVMQIH